MKPAPSRPASALRLPEVGPRCTGCGRCVAACAPAVLWLDTLAGRKRALLHDPAGCTGCARCAVVCPFDAIRLRRGPAGADAA